MDEKHKRGVGVFWTSIGLLILLILYPLSVGPLCWLANRGAISEPVLEYLELVYSPLEYVFAIAPASEEQFENYVELWE